MRKIKKRSFCGISSTLDILGDKWSLLIIRDLIFRGKNTYGEFLKSDEKIATNILAERLAVLESAGIISKHAHPESKAKFIYRLTAKGIELIPILVEIILWSEKYLEISENGKALAEKFKTDKQGAINKIIEGLNS